MAPLVTIGEIIVAIIVVRKAFEKGVKTKKLILGSLFGLIGSSFLGSFFGSFPRFFPRFFPIFSIFLYLLTYFLIATLLSSIVIVIIKSVKNKKYSESTKDYSQYYEENNNSYKKQYSFNESYREDEYFKKAISIFGLNMNYNEYELKNSYKEIMKKYHPDKYVNEKPEIRKLVEEKTKEANEMYEYLLKWLRTNGT
jgi:hypothetical protein